MKAINLLPLLLFLFVSSMAMAQKKYQEISDSNRIILLEQKVKKNRINVSGFQQDEKILRKPTFTKKKGIRELKFPIDTAKSFEIELLVKINRKKGVLNIWGASRPNIADPTDDSEKDILYQFDMWADGIYNVLQRLYKILIGVKDLKKIRTDDAPDSRLITIRKIKKEVQFFVNKNLILVILPPDPVNEIGFLMKENGVKIEHIRIAYLAEFTDSNQEE